MATKEFCDWRGIVALGLAGSKASVHRRVREGLLPKPIRWGNRHIWAREDVVKYVRGLAK